MKRSNQPHRREARRTAALYRLEHPRKPPKSPERAAQIALEIATLQERIEAAR